MKGKSFSISCGIAALIVLICFMQAPAYGDSGTTKTAPQKVVFWHMWTGEWQKVVARIVASFNDSQSDYKVAALSVPAFQNNDMANTKLLMSVAGGDPPDCMAQWNPVIPSWASEGALVPLDELMSKKEFADLKETIFPIAWKTGAYKDRLYGLCLAMNVWSLYYRKDYFREAGLDPEKFPTHTHELDEIARKLDVIDEDGKIKRIGFLPYMQVSAWNLPVIFWPPVFGGTYYDWDKQEVVVYNDGTLRALEWVQSYTERYGLKRIINFMASFQTGQLAAIDWPFISGGYAITVDGQWRVEQLSKFAPELDYGTAAVPYPVDGGKKHAGWSYGNFMIVPKGAKFPDGAWAFMRYWAGIQDPDIGAEIATWGGWLPLKQSVIDSPVYQAYIDKYPQFRTFVEILPSENLQVTPPVAYQSYLQSRMGQIAESVIRLSVTPQEALDKLNTIVIDQEEKLKR
ncbi:ABC transporter substrate-binding protein [Candidatus Hydrogenedentota bacterium]